MSGRRAFGRPSVKTFSAPSRAEPRRRVPCALCGASESRPLWDCGGFSFVRCRGCGLVRQDPQPERGAVAARYGGEYLDYELERQSAYRDLELLALADLGLDAVAAPLIAARAASGAAPRVLDVGCATGALLDALRDRGWDAAGAEISPQMAAYCRERRGLPVRSGSIESAAFAGASFELAHASHLIEHLNDPASFLDEAARVLVPGGLLALTTPNVDGFQARLLGRNWRSAINDHLYLFSLRSLCELLRRRGFDILRTVTWGGWAAGLEPAFIKRPLDRWAKRSGRGDVAALLARKREAAAGT